jgi:ribosomal protein S18 acetylase RimI-like enzyme
MDKISLETAFLLAFMLSKVWKYKNAQIRRKTVFWIQSDIVRKEKNRKEQSCMKHTANIRHLTGNENITISAAIKADLKEILHLQKQAFITEAELHGNYDIEPLRQTYESILSDFDPCRFLKAVSGGKIIGSVKYRALDDKVWIGKLMVDTGYRGRGLGKRLLAEVEKANPGAKKFQLFTAASSAHNIRLYESVGYSVCRHYQDDTQGGFLMVEMEKMTMDDTNK